MRMIGSMLSVLGVAAAAACAGSDAVAPPQISAWSGTVTLVAPLAGARFVQNDTLIGCPTHATRGSGFRLSFDWGDVERADRYAIHLKRVGALFPVIDQNVYQSQVEFTSCNSFVIDANLDGWVWRVAAIDDRPGAMPDTLWSEERGYGFQPCRLAGGVPCNAPAELLRAPE